MKELKIENIGTANAVNAPANAPEIKEEVKNTSKDTAEPTTEATKEAITKHVIVYLGNSAYTDCAGHKWHKNDEHTYSDEEYENRHDLHFMIKYGEMKHTIVTI